MSVRKFWVLNKNIDRINAETDHRLLMVMISAASGEGAQKLSDKLQRRMGQVAIFDEAKQALTQAEAERDRAGLFELKGMGRL